MNEEMTRKLPGSAMRWQESSEGGPAWIPRVDLDLNAGSHFFIVCFGDSCIFSLQLAHL